jgi:GT2 family glycosyltransferase
MLDEIGLFDEDFLMYLEDVDLAWRAQWAGWRCEYVPEAVVYHVHSGTAQEGSSFQLRLLGRNKVWTVCKNYPFPPILWYAPAMLLYDVMAVGYGAVVDRQLDTLWGRVGALAGLVRMVSKRSKRVRRASWREMMARLQPAEGPLAMLRRYGRT